MGQQAQRRQGHSRSTCCGSARLAQRGDGSPITTHPRLPRPHDAVPGRGRYVLRHRIEAAARATRLDALSGPRLGELQSVQRDAARRSRYRLRAASLNRLADRRSDSSTEHGAQREGTVDERFTDVQSASEPGAATPLTAATGECSNGPCARPASSPRAQPRPGFALMLRVVIALAFPRRAQRTTGTSRLRWSDSQVSPDVGVAPPALVLFDVWEDAENITNRTVKAPPKAGQNAAPGGISRPQLALRGTSLEH